EDCVSKPYRVLELKQRIKNALRASRGDQTGRGSTMPPTRAELGMSLEYELTRAERYGHPVTLVRLALEPAGPWPAELGVALRVALLEAARAHLRASDLVFTTGEREIALLLPETDEPGARLVAERIRDRAASMPAFEAAPGGVGAVRFGFACARDHGVRDP